MCWPMSGICQKRENKLPKSNGGLLIIMTKGIGILFISKGDIFLMLLAVIFGLSTLFISITEAAVEDYDPITGEPNCMNCHTPDKKYSIDYTREETCAECHGSDLSERYISIDERYTIKKAINIEDMEINLISNPLSTTSAQKQGLKNKKEDIKKKQKGTKDMVFIPAGDFTMGTNDWWPKSSPEHKRYIDAFYIDKYEVTNARYKAFVNAANYQVPDHWINGKIPEGRAKHPVVFVNWFDADAFCKWEGKRLPTEAEWEKAARGTDKRIFPWGDKFDKNMGNTPQYGKGNTMPVGSFENGKSPYGAYDMAGNVFEWTEDWFKPYPGNTHSDENYGERFKVVRGGSWYDCTSYKCGISSPTYNRIFFNQQTTNDAFGFRCAIDAK